MTDYLYFPNIRVYVNYTIVFELINTKGSYCLTVLCECTLAYNIVIVWTAKLYPSLQTFLLASGLGPGWCQATTRVLATVNVKQAVLGVRVKCY